MSQRAIVFILPYVVLLACSGGEPKAAETNAAPSTSKIEAEANAPSLAGFEGEVAIEMTSVESKSGPRTITLQAKGNKLKFAVPEGVESARAIGDNAYVIVDVANKKLTAVAGEKHQLFVLDLDRVSKLVEQMKPAQTPNGPAKAAPKFEKTGHRDTVAGRSCEDWDVTSANGDKSRICVTGEGVAWFTLPTLNLPAEHAWARELMDGHHLPLRVVSFDAAGKEKFRLEVKKLEQKSLDDSLFTPPADYKVIDLAEMMGRFSSMMAVGKPNADGSAPTVPGMPPGVKMSPKLQAMIEKMKAAQAAKGAARPPH